MVVIIVVFDVVVAVVIFDVVVVVVFVTLAVTAHFDTSQFLGYNCNLYGETNADAVAEEAVVQAPPATLLEKRLWHRCFPVNFAKFLRTPFHRTPLVAASLAADIALVSVLHFGRRRGLFC